MDVYAIAIHVHVYNGAQIHHELCWLRKLLCSVLQSSKQLCYWVACFPIVLHACRYMCICSDNSFE